MPFTSFEEVEQYLSAIPKFQSDHTEAADFNLRKFERFCREIGNPQDDFPSIHVAGTNGKGSTCRLLTAIYREAGYTVGIYTSPHILRFQERFEINGREMPEDELCSFFREHHRRIEAHKLTYFEISTAIAFWWFSKSGIDIGIIETGLGGRLDATNVVTPLASVITSISLDHTDILGDTLAEVAREKAGIIKAGRPVVTGRLPKAAEEVVRRTARKRGCRLLDIDALQPAFQPDGRISLQTEEGTLTLETPLRVPVQALNVAMAWQVVRALRATFPVERAAFERAMATARLGMGRFERLRDGRRWFFDGAHNIEAVKAVKESVATVGEPDEAVLVLSLMRDKIHPEVMNAFSEFKNIYYYSLNTKRAASIDEIKSWLPQVMAFPSQTGQRQQLLKEFDSKLVIFAGSFYFYATVRDWMKTVA